MPHTVIIAEAGVNHNGSIQLAKQLVDAAVEAGVDYVKFQTFKAELIVTGNAPKASYQQANLPQQGQSQYEMLKRLELSVEQHLELIGYCNNRGIRFLSTAFDMESLEFLASLKMELWKIPSGEITNYPYLKRIAQLGKPVILSTGMCTMDDIASAVSVLYDYGVRREHLTILHCNTQYPTPLQDVNLLAMQTIAKQFGVSVGYSDHTQGMEVSLAAVALGASVIEKHFTLDNDMEGPDHKASLNPAALKSMVQGIRIVEQALGEAKKVVTASEMVNINAARKSIVAAREIHKGDVLTDDHITCKRPAGGISPMEWERVIGSVAKRDFQPDDMIEL